GGRQRELIMGDRDLAAAYQRGWGQVDPRGALGLQPQQSGDQVTVLAHRIDEEAMAIATAVAHFAGSEEDDVDGVTAAYTAMMDDIQAYQNSAGEHLAQTAASLYAVGAEVGVKLAMHQEQHDEDSRAELVEAVTLLGQWAKSLTAG